MKISVIQIYRLSIIVAFFVLFAACAQNSSENSQAETHGRAQIQFDTTMADLGTLQRGEKAEYSYYFENTGKGTLIIKEIITDCGCTAANADKDSYLPGEEGKITILLNTEQLRNNQYKVTTVISNATDSVSELKMAAFVESEYQLKSTN